MKCPHCLVEIHAIPSSLNIGSDKDGGWMLERRTCPACGRFILSLLCGDTIDAPHGPVFTYTPKIYLVRPKAASRTPPPAEVPKELADDYREACLVIVDSPKASAALSRRCLQHLLRDFAKVKHADLFAEIQEAINRGNLPSHIVESIDAVRTIGNFAAHPDKSTATGEIINVEPGEAEWNLETLEALFDFYFVQPEVIKRKREALDAKLKAAGKPKMK
jgi:hypothetical protein